MLENVLTILTLKCNIVEKLTCFDYLVSSTTELFALGMVPAVWAYGVVVSMFDYHRSDRGSNPGLRGKIS